MSNPRVKKKMNPKKTETKSSPNLFTSTKNLLGWHSWHPLSKTIVKLFPVLFILLAIPLTVNVLQKQQNITQKAASPDQLEAEGGVLGGDAVVVSDSNASGGQSVRFAMNTPTLTPATMPTSTPAPSGSVVAFPGAQGFGASSVGGRGGVVIEVTNLNDSGAGSLRAALIASGPRIVVFRTGGIINLISPIAITQPYLTIAGQTAPGGGIAVKGPTISIETHDVIIRGMRIRNGTTSTNPDYWDTMPIYGYGASGVYNIIFDHNSISWGIDENTSTYADVNNITFSWNIISEALMNAQHDKGAHSMGILFGGTAGLATKVSMHHNLLAHNNQRNPRVQGNKDLEIVNNIIYNYGQIGMEITNNDDNTISPTINIISNYYKPGVNSSNSKAVVTVSSGPSQSIYVSGNISPQRTSLTSSEWSFMNGSLASLQRSTPLPMSANPVTVTAYPTFTNSVYQCSGAIVPRDSVDTRIVSSAQNGTGSIIDSPSQVGGWPTLAAGTAPTDTDHDAMPDSWETSHGLNPNNAADRNITSPNGYTWVEEYINSLINCA